MSIKDEEEYKKLLISEKNAIKNKKKFNYRVQDVECCQTCEHSFCRRGEDSLECELINPEYNKWIVEDVYFLCICDKYEKKREER